MSIIVKVNKGRGGEGDRQRARLHTDRVFFIYMYMYCSMKVHRQILIGPMTSMFVSMIHVDEGTTN